MTVFVWQMCMQYYRAHNHEHTLTEGFIFIIYYCYMKKEQFWQYFCSLTQYSLLLAAGFHKKSEDVHYYDWQNQQKAAIIVIQNISF